MELGSLFIESFAEAIAEYEGFWKAGSRPERNRNPGDLRAGRFAMSKDQAGYAVYATYEGGWSDLREQVKRNLDRGLSMLEFFAGKPNVYSGFAPSGDNNVPEAYAKFVAGRLYKKGWTVPLDGILRDYL